MSLGIYRTAFFVRSFLVLLQGSCGFYNIVAGAFFGRRPCIVAGVSLMEAIALYLRVFLMEAIELLMGS